MKTHRRSAFTLIELLVVIAIIAILAVRQYKQGQHNLQTKFSMKLGSVYSPPTPSVAVPTPSSMDASGLDDGELYEVQDSHAAPQQTTMNTTFNGAQQTYDLGHVEVPTGQTSYENDSEEDI